MSTVNDFSVEGTTNAPAVDLLRVNTLRGTKTAFLSSKRYDEHTSAFYVVPPPGHLCNNNGEL